MSSKTPSSTSPSLSCFLTNPELLLRRLTKLTSTYSGLDASLMLVQYSSPLVIALLLKLAKLKSRYRRSSSKVRNPTQFGLVKLAEGWGNMGRSVGEARVVFRAFGILPILTWLLTLHPNPIKSLKSLILSFGQKGSLTESEKTIPTLQAISLLLYYPLEHLSWLAVKGVIPLSLERRGKAELWSVRFWALYVMLEIYKLRQTYISLLKRTKLLKYSKPEIKEEEAGGFELPPSPSSLVPPISAASASGSNEKSTVYPQTSESRILAKEELKNDWKVWKNSVMINSGYAPLTIHWSTPGGLWTSPLIGGSLGVVAAIGRLTAEWRKE